MLTIYADAFMTATRHKNFNLHEIPTEKRRRRWPPRRAYLEIDVENL